MELIFQNIHQKKMNYLDYCKYYSGPKYNVLDKDYQKYEDGCYIQNMKF